MTPLIHTRTDLIAKLGHVNSTTEHGATVTFACP